MSYLNNIGNEKTNKWLFQYSEWGQGNFNFPLHVPFNPGPHHIFVRSHFFAFFWLQNSYFSHLLYTSSPRFSLAPTPCPLNKLSVVIL